MDEFFNQIDFGPLKQFLDNYAHKVQNGEVMIEDMSISKLALMAISI